MTRTTIRTRDAILRAERDATDLPGRYGAIVRTKLEEARWALRALREEIEAEASPTEKTAPIEVPR